MMVLTNTLSTLSLDIIYEVRSVACVFDALLKVCVPQMSVRYFAT